MSSLKDNKTCALLEQYLSYLIVVKGRSPLTAEEYRVDCNMLFEYIKRKRGVPEEILIKRNFSDVDIDFIKSISIADLYAFITYCGESRNVTTATRARKIVSIRQFWKYLKNKAHLLDNNIAEELESPKLPKRMPKYLSLDESIRLLIESEKNPRDYCVLTIFLNCALRLSELVNLNIEQVQSDFTGKLLIVKASDLSPQYRYADSQLVQCTHGNGARPNAKGRSVFGTELYSGASVAYDRSSILGVADENKLPQWAKVKLEIQRDPAVFEFGGYHFKPYRQFHKGEVERHLKGDSRPWKMDAAYAMRNMSSDRSLGVSTYDWGKTDYSHSKFYAAANSEADIFICLENGKLYVPNENELFRYNEPPQKEQVKTGETKYKECTSAIDKDVSAVRYDEMPGDSARYDLKTALDRLNYQHGTENVNAVLAAVVIFNDNDGRYSRENRQWAASVPNPPVDVVRRCTINTHPIILNGLVDKARESTTKARETRPDFLGKINDNKQKVEQNKANADSPAKKKNRDGQEV